MVVHTKRTNDAKGIMAAGIGCIVGIGAYFAPRYLRIPGEIAACIVGPMWLFYRAWRIIPEVVLRMGSSLVSTVAIWIITSVTILSIYRQLDAATSIVMIIAVYLMSTIAMILVNKAGWKQIDLARDKIDVS